MPLEGISLLPLVLVMGASLELDSVRFEGILKVRCDLVFKLPTDGAFRLVAVDVPPMTITTMVDPLTTCSPPAVDACSAAQPSCAAICGYREFRHGASPAELSPCRSSFHGGVQPARGLLTPPARI